VSAALLSAALILSACTAGSPPAESPDIRGTVTSFDISGGVGSILVEGEIEQDTGYDRASVRIEEGTSVFDSNGDAIEASDVVVLAD